MKAKSLALCFADLGISKSHSRPHVSNDNPFSEAHFKTLKYRPEFPEFFPSVEAARSFMLNSAPGTTINIITAGLPFSRRPTFTSAARRKFWRVATPCCRRFGSNILGAFTRTVPRNAALPTAVYINKPIENHVHLNARQ